MLASGTADDDTSRRRARAVLQADGGTIGQQHATEQLVGQRMENRLESGRRDGWTGGVSEQARDGLGRHRKGAASDAVREAGMIAGVGVSTGGQSAAFQAREGDYLFIRASRFGPKA